MFWPNTLHNGHTNLCKGYYGVCSNSTWVALILLEVALILYEVNRVHNLPGFIESVFKILRFVFHVEAMNLRVCVSGFSERKSEESKHALSFD